MTATSTSIEPRVGAWGYTGKLRRGDLVQFRWSEEDEDFGEGKVVRYGQGWVIVAYRDRLNDLHTLSVLEKNIRRVFIDQQEAA